MSINYSPEYSITVQQLKEDFQNGTRVYTASDRYIRGSINDADVEAKKATLIFKNDDGSEYISVTNPLLFFTNEEGKKELVQGNNRTRALFEMLVDAKYKDYDFRNIPFKNLEDGWTKDDLYTIQVSLNDSTTGHKPAALARIVMNRKNELINEYADVKMNDKAKKGAITKRLREIFQIDSDMHISRLLNVAGQSQGVQDLLDQEVITVSDVVKVNQSAAKVGKSVETIFQELTELVGTGEKIPAKSIEQYLNKDKVKSTETATATTTESTEKPPLHLTSSEFTERVEGLVNKYTILPASANLESLTANPSDVSKVAKASLKSLVGLFDILGNEEILEIFPDLFNLASKLLSNPEQLKERAKVSDKPLGEVYSNLLGLEKSVDGLYNAVYNPKPEKEVKEPKAKKEKKVSEAPATTDAQEVATVETLEAPVDYSITEGVAIETLPSEVTVDIGTHTATIS